jgi:hypothetical protein
MEEWCRFLETVEQLALDGDKQVPALLVRDFAAEKPASLVLLAGSQLDRVEANSPDGWIDYPEAVEDRWIFLAGDRYLAKRLGLNSAPISRAYGKRTSCGLAAAVQTDMAHIYGRINDCRNANLDRLAGDTARQRQPREDVSAPIGGHPSPPGRPHRTTRA